MAVTPSQQSFFVVVMSINLDNLVEDVSKSRYSSVGNVLNNQDISAVWDAVADYVQKQLLARRGVNLKNLGIFTLAISRLDVGNNQFIQITRPVFIPSLKFLQSHGLTSNQSTPQNDVPVNPINFSALSFETPYGRDVVERCIHDVVVLLENNIRSGKTIDFLFKGIGRLLIGDGRMKLRFFKEFMNNFDKSGRLVKSLRGRPHTVDSVMSDSAAFIRPPSIGFSGTGVKEVGRAESGDMAAGNTLQPIVENHQEEAQHQQESMDVVEAEQRQHGEGAGRVQVTEAHEGCGCRCHNHTHNLVDHIGAGHDDETGEAKEDVDVEAVKTQAALDLAAGLPAAGAGDDDSAQGGLATAGIVDLAAVRERVATAMAVRNRPSSAHPFCSTCVNCDCSASRNPLKPPARAAAAAPGLASSNNRQLPPLQPGGMAGMAAVRPDSCVHSLGGQELCYVCYQRARLNQPLDLKPLRRQREVEEDRMWGEQNKLEAIKFRAEQEERVSKQQEDSEKTAAFNLGISEAKRATKTIHRQPDLCPSYLMPKRSTTPVRDLRVVLLKDDVRKQMEERRREDARKKQEELVSGQVEQLELRRATIDERERLDRQRQKQLKEYRDALDEQMRSPASPIPGRQPDSDEPIFGALDGANVPERRQQAVEVASEQMDTVAARRRAEVLRRIQEQREEQVALRRACSDLKAERSEQYRRVYEARRCLETEWLEAAREKRERDKTQRLRYSTPGLLMHEQCDQYRRCGQCQKKCSNNGRSNIWTETYYINGSRFIV